MKPVLSPKEVAEAIGVSESSLKRWADAGHLHVHRTAGGHRRIRITDAIRFIRETGATVIRPEVLGLPDAGSMQVAPLDSKSDSERLLEFLQAGQAPEARGLLVSLYLSGRTIAELADGPIRDAMRQIGTLWNHGEEGIFVEHRATEICLQAAHQLRLLIEVPEHAPCCVGCAPEDDPYLLPTALAAGVLAEAGFAAVNLGPDTPAGALRAAIAAYRPALIWLSVSSASRVDDWRDEVLDLLSLAQEAHVTLVLGGQRAGDLKLPTHARLLQAQSMSELAAFARGVATGAAKNRAGE